MKVIKIDKEKWAGGVESLSNAYRLFGPVKEDDSHTFKELSNGALPDLEEYSNTKRGGNPKSRPPTRIVIDRPTKTYNT